MTDKKSKTTSEQYRETNKLNEQLLKHQIMNDTYDYGDDENNKKAGEWLKKHWSEKTDS